VSADLLVNTVGHTRNGDTVLVHGAAGGVGRAIAGLARLAGAGAVLGTVGSLRRVDAARRAGYDVVLNRDTTLAEAITTATGGRGVDLVLDPQGTALLDLDLQVAAPGARVVLFGNAGGDPLAALPPLPRLMATNTSIAGFSLAALAATAPQRVAASLSRILDHLVTGALDVPLTRVHDLADAPKAQQALADGNGDGKYVVEIGPFSPGR
jgi:NADPH2:quinone reductase